MNFRLHKRRGMSTVITTMIILIASVVLGAGTILFGGNLFQSNSQGDSMQVTNVKSWVTLNGTSSVTAFAVQNTGGKPISISSVMYRGQSVPFSNWYYNTTMATATNIASDLPYTTLTPPTTPITLNSGTAAMQTTTGPVTIAQGKAAIFYLIKAGNLGPIDTGQTFTINILGGAANAAQLVTVQRGTS